MPTVIYIGNVKIRIYPKDHPPPHVHAVGPGCEAKFEIESMACLFSRGFSEKDLRCIQQYLLGRREYLMEVWNEYQKD
jgi:hypothetical protein